jgi:hypothetical protein
MPMIDFTGDPSNGRRFREAFDASRERAPA